MKNSSKRLNQKDGTTGNISPENGEQRDEGNENGNAHDMRLGYMLQAGATKYKVHIQMEKLASGDRQAFYRADREAATGHSSLAILGYLGLFPWAQL